MNAKTIAFHHFGCKVNFAEASSLSRQFEEKGYILTDFHELADIYVISTCVVTTVAEKKCRAAIRQAHHLNPQAKIAVIGCFSELKPGEIAQMEGVDLVLGHQGKFNLLEELTALDVPGQSTLASSTSTPETVFPVETEHTTDQIDYHGGIGEKTKSRQEAFVPSFSYGDRTRSFLKIQDGCDYFCSYCTIPLARGRSRSDSIENVVRNVREILTHDIREIVLTGVNIGDFGRHRNENFLQLIMALDQLEGMCRTRISSIEPDLLSNEIISFVADSNHFLPHFHIPLQSGCNRILKAMHRKYTRELYASRVSKIKELMPFACIAADVIVGFPGESEEDFQDTYDFLNEIDISYLHVFTYSQRDNTIAARSESVVANPVKKHRSEILHRLSDKKKTLFYQKNLGRTVTVLFESNNNQGFIHGFSDNYIKVKTRYSSKLVNKLAAVKLEVMDHDDYLTDETAITEYES